MNLQYWAGQPGSDQTSAATGGVDLVFQAVVSFFTACNPFWLRFAVLGPTLNPTRQFLLRFSWTTVCASVILVLVRIRPMPAANEPELIRFVRDMTLRWPCRRAGGQPCSCRQGIGSRWWRHAGRGGRACWSRSGARRGHLHGREHPCRSGPRQVPPMRIRDGGSQRDGIEIGIRVTEGMPCGVIEVLAVEEHDGPLRRRFERHSAGPKSK